MCGIVGYIGSSPALPHLLDSLQTLEYRGYDSAGIAVYNEEHKAIEICKAKGKLENLVSRARSASLRGNMGIGHTRWATQGVPSDLNAHPHQNTHKDIAVVHNGVITNYVALKEELEREYGIHFTTSTDTEVIAHLLGTLVEEKQTSLHAALEEAVQRLEGSYAICAICTREPDKILLTCKEAPLVLGIGGSGELICASDSTALLRYTKEVVRLRDKQIAEMRSDGTFTVFAEGKQVINPCVQILTTDASSLDKGGYKHFLLKEIHEQPLTLKQLFMRHVANCGAQLTLQFPSLKVQELAQVERIIIVGCGTAYYAGLVGKMVAESLARLPVDVEFASEMLAREPLINDKTLVIAISQSGETTDTLLAAKGVLSNGGRLLAICNRPDSSLVDLARGQTLFTQAGTEVSVAATKSFTAQLACLYLLFIHLAKLRETISESEQQWFIHGLKYMPQVLEQALARKDTYKAAIIPFSSKKAFAFLGRSISYPVALEGALKLKEITYMQASGYAAGEMKHGPIATIDEEVPILAILPEGPTKHKTLHNAVEAKTRGAPCLGIVMDNEDKGVLEALDVKLAIPRLPFSEEYPKYADILSPFLTVIPLQLASYYLAEYLGKDVDQPRNLAKSVTVE